jgi:hypothetical protein
VDDYIKKGERERHDQRRRQEWRSRIHQMMNRMWRKRVKDTDVLGEVGGGAAVEDPLCGR